MVTIRLLNEFLPIFKVGMNWNVSFFIGLYLLKLKEVPFSANQFALFWLFCSEGFVKSCVPQINNMHCKTSKAVL